MDPTKLLLSFVLAAFTVACLSWCFQHFMEEDMIFHKYGQWLNSFNRHFPYKYIQNKVYNNWSFYIRQNIMYYLKYPLGYCPYCNSTWIGIVVFIYFFKLKVTIVLFIGLVWFWVRVLDLTINRPWKNGAFL